MSAMGYGSDNQPPLYGWSSWKSPSTLSWLGEYKISMKVTNFKTCNKDDKGNWTALSNVNTNQRVCEMNFAVTKPYMVSRGPLGNFATDTLKSFVQLPEGQAVFTQGVPPLTQNFVPNQNVKDAVQKLVDTYDKLAVSVGTLPNTNKTLFKVP